MKEMLPSKPTQIENQDLATEMAMAENPYRILAANATKLQLTDMAKGYLDQAEKTANEKEIKFNQMTKMVEAALKSVSLEILDFLEKNLTKIKKNERFRLEIKPYELDDEEGRQVFLDRLLTLFGSNKTLYLEEALADGYERTYPTGISNVTIMIDRFFKAPQGALHSKAFVNITAQSACDQLRLQAHEQKETRDLEKKKK